MCTGAEAVMVGAALVGTATSVATSMQKPSAQAQPKVPAKTDQDVEAAGARERALARLRKGRASTILTPLAAEGASGTAGKKTLLGA